jgi:hypothetical protein
VQPRARTYGKVEAPAGAPAPKVAVPASPDAG